MEQAEGQGHRAPHPTPGRVATLEREGSPLVHALYGGAILSCHWCKTQGAH